jgi:tRNA pseudouridine55 synthase
MEGLLVVDKPVGPTSHDVVVRVRRASGERRIGHTGTLDPGASGVLPLVLGRATRLARYLSGADKSYKAVVRLGIETDTHDAEGRSVGEPFNGTLPDRAVIEQALGSFRGTFEQRPPIFSAKKISGVRSHRLARQPHQPPLEAPSPVTVQVHELRLLDVAGADLELAVTCSAGFYVRSLAHDLGQRLGTGAHLAGLTRTRSGDLRLEMAVALDRIEHDRQALFDALIPLERMLTAYPAAALTEDGLRKARHGQTLRPGDVAAKAASVSTSAIRLLDPAGNLVGMATPDALGLLHPVVILV